MARIVIRDRARARARRAGIAVGLLALAASLVVGSDLFGVREQLFGSATPPPRPPVFSRVADDSAATKAERTVLRSQPWWQRVDRLRGAGTATTRAFTIADGALQWRVTWTCRSGRLVVRAPGRPAPLIDAACPGKKTSYAFQKGQVSLQVTADGPWQMDVEQQLDVPLNEPPLRAMTAPRTIEVATGAFYRVDQAGRGRATIYRLPDGRYALRLRNFYVTPNTDLELRLSPVPAPHSTRQFRSAPSAFVRFLDVTAGSMNFVLPRGVDPGRYRSVVIWCERLLSAYSAATLTAPRA